MLSIYSSFFNIQASGFAWRESLTNWLSFLRETGEIVIAVNTSTDGTANLVREFFKARQIEFPRVATQVVECDIPYTDPAFDGKIKAVALSHCTQPFAILLDCDEVVVPSGSSRRNWMRLVMELEQDRRYDAFFVPTIDLFHDEMHYKCGGESLGAKWYLHRNIPNITRGVVRWAYRDDGTIDITRSDTCELIYKDTGELVKVARMLMQMPHYVEIMQIGNGDVPFVYHLGWLDKQQRLKQSEFWTPVWNARNGSEVERQKTIAELEAIQFYKHALPRWRTL